MIADCHIITQQSHPGLFGCFEIISHDSGNSAGHINYIVPMTYLADDLLDISCALSALSPEERLTFCIGEISDMAEIAGRSETLDMAYNLLGDFFDHFGF